MPKEYKHTFIQSLNNLCHKERWIGLFAGFFILLATLLLDPPTNMSIDAWHCMGMSLLMAIWWSTEAIPIPATALLPIILIPALDLGTIHTATASYANPTIYLFLGGFLIGLAMEKCNLHKRIALNILQKVGLSPNRQIAGFMLATAFLSMWVSNTATTIIMMPSALSVVTLLIAENKSEDSQRFKIALLLCIAYAANIGGMATLIGTPPNALLHAFLEEHYQIKVGFLQWMLLGVPIASALLIFTYWWLTHKPFKVYNNWSQAGSVIIKEELNKLGSISGAEKMVAIVFVVAIIGWVTRPLLSPYIPFLNDTFIAMAAGMALFLIPANIAKYEFLMGWEQANKLPWGILILLGGGLSLADVIDSSTLANWLASQLLIFSDVSLIAMIAIITTSIIVLTSITLNTTTTAVFLPLVGVMAVSQGIEPQFYAIPVALAASCAFVLPVSTLPNAIVFSSGLIPVYSMIKAGMALNIFSLFAIVFISMFLLPYIF